MFYVITNHHRTATLLSSFSWANNLFIDTSYTFHLDLYLYHDTVVAMGGEGLEKHVLYYWKSLFDNHVIHAPQSLEWFQSLTAS